MIIFPSFMIHRVAPVTKGKRKSVVVWVTGPKFK
jgi:PKHD-type hydroxylase